ncbi:MAG: hypothetical protein IKS37_00350 [Solobacterium sp.]|nr:hypothetical protein [Solobacterium sp.]
MHIRILEENAYTKQSEENLQEMIRKTKGAESILWMGENLYMLAGKADTLSAVQKKAEKQITAIKKSSRIRTIRYTDGSVRVEYPEQKTGCYIPAAKRSGHPAISQEEAEYYGTRIRSALKDSVPCAVYLVKNK